MILKSVVKKLGQLNVLAQELAQAVDPNTEIGHQRRALIASMTRESMRSLIQQIEEAEPRMVVMELLDPTAMSNETLYRYALVPRDPLVAPFVVSKIVEEA